MTLSGHCYCGAVRYETESAAFNETICHCADCRRVTGATSVAWFSVARSGYRVTKGRPAEFPSSPGVTRSFCGACGTALTWQTEKWPDEIDVTICSLDDPDQVVPRDHTFAASRPCWSKIAGGIPQYPERRPPAVD